MLNSPAPQKLPLAAILTFALTACGRTQQSQPAQGVIERPTQTETAAAAFPGPSAPSRAWNLTPR